MDNNVTISNVRENVLEFDLTIEGLSTKDVEAQFVIKGKGVNFAFAAKQDKGSKWKVTIPKMTTLEKTTYECSIVVVADGYYFEPMKGNCTVVGTHQIYVSEPRNQTVSPTDKKSEQKKETDSQKKNADKEKKSTDDQKESADKEKKQPKTSSVKESSSRSRSIKQIADELINREKISDTTDLFEKTFRERRERQTKVDSALDVKVREILNASKELPKSTPLPNPSVVQQPKTPVASVPLTETIEHASVDEPKADPNTDDKVRQIIESVAGMKRRERNKRRFSLRDN